MTAVTAVRTNRTIDKTSAVAAILFLFLVVAASVLLFLLGNPMRAENLPLDIILRPNNSFNF